MAPFPMETDPTKTPVIPNPNGDPPNFTDPPSLERAILSVGFTLIVISATFLAIRIFANFKNAWKLGLDDCKNSLSSSVLWRQAKL